MSFTLDPEVVEALALFAAEMAGSTRSPGGDVAARRATLTAPTGVAAPLG
jgi:hypothetical protein